jgi:16S rRNA processing protein RimM
VGEPAEAELVVIGRVVKPHGIRGEVVVESLSDVPGRFDADLTVVLGGTPTRILSTRPHQGRLLITFEGVVDRSAAERLRGRTIEAAAVALDDTDAYFAHELVGLPVRGDDGRELGTVSALIELPAAAGYDLLEVRRADGSSWLLPAVDDYVEVVEDADGTIHLAVVDPPEGLVDGEPAVVRPDADVEPDAAPTADDRADGTRGPDA